MVRGCTTDTGTKFFCSPKMSRPVLGSTQPLIQWAQPLIFRGKTGKGVMLTTYFHQLRKLRISGAIPPKVFISTTRTISRSLTFSLRIMKAGCTLFSVSFGTYYAISIHSFPGQRQHSHRAAGLLPHCQLT